MKGEKRYTLFVQKMDSDSDNESIEGDVDSMIENPKADWGKAKFDYYYTDYVDKDYPSKLTAKEERLASIEQEEALRIQRKLLSTLEDVDIDLTYDDEEPAQGGDEENLLDLIEHRNSLIGASSKKDKTNKRKRVVFEDQKASDDEESSDEDEEYFEADCENDNNQGQSNDTKEDSGRQRRPINVAIQKNRGLTPYKKKEYRNPRVKHKLKYKKAMSKRRRNIKQVQTEYHRYSGEASGIKTSTVKSVKLC